MRLSKDQVKHVAKLANLPLTPDEEEKYSGQLSKILDYIDQLNKVDTSSVEPTYNVSGLSNVTRKDEVGECLTQEDAILNAPRNEQVLSSSARNKKGFIVTKGIFNDE